MDLATVSGRYLGTSAPVSSSTVSCAIFRVENLQNLVIIVGGVFMLVIIAMCVSLLKALRNEPYEATLPSRLRRAVQYVQRHDQQEQHALALAALGADHRQIVPDADEQPGNP